MGQTTVVLPRLKIIYRKIIRNSQTDRVVHYALNILVEILARLRNFSFPKKFDWDWKWEMLMGLYEQETTVLCKRIIKPGMRVADVGAHAGYFTRLYSDLVGSTGVVYAFEPDPENFALLKKNTRHLKNVKLFPMAVSDKVGTVNFYETENNTGCHSLIASRSRSNKIIVNSTTLDALFNSGEIQRLDLIKIDIEGAEPMALKGMQSVIAANPKIALIVEFCPENLRESHVDPGGFINSIRSLGLHISAIKKEGLKEITPDDCVQGRFYLNNHYVNLFVSGDRN